MFFTGPGAGRIPNSPSFIALDKTRERGTPGPNSQAALCVRIAPLFLGTLIAIFQVCIYIFVQQALQNAATQAGRLFMTNGGQSLSQQQYKQAVCDSYLPAAIFNCSNLIVVVQSYSDFASANTSAPSLYSNGTPVTSWAYDTGAPGEVMVVQLVYPWSVISGPLGFSLATLPNNQAEMRGVTAFRVEPAY